MEARHLSTDGDADAVATNGYPPLRLAPGTVFIALLGVVVLVGQAVFARTVPQLVYALVGIPVLFIGAMGRWQVPVWHTRLPVGVQAVLCALLLLVTIPVLVVDDGFNPLVVLWILSFALFPDLLPDRLRTWLETSVR